MGSSVESTASGESSSMVTELSTEEEEEEGEEEEEEFVKEKSLSEGMRERRLISKKEGRESNQNFGELYPWNETGFVRDWGGGKAGRIEGGVEK